VKAVVAEVEESGLPTQRLERTGLVRRLQKVAGPATGS